MTFAGWNTLVQFVGTKMSKISGCVTFTHVTNSFEMWTLQQSSSQISFESFSKPIFFTYCSLYGCRMHSTNCLHVSILLQWLLVHVRSHPSSSHCWRPAFIWGRHLWVVPVNINWNGRRLSYAADDTATVLCRLSSMPWTKTCFEPFSAQVLDLPVGTRWIPVWSVLTIISGVIEWAFTK